MAESPLDPNLVWFAADGAWFKQPNVTATCHEPSPTAPPTTTPAPSLSPMPTPNRMSAATDPELRLAAESATNDDVIVVTANISLTAKVIFMTRYATGILLKGEADSGLQVTETNLSTPCNLDQI